MEKALKYVIWAGLAVVCFVPLIVGSSYYFPYIVPKTVVFKAVVLMMFLAYLGLAVISKKYRLKLNLVLALFLSYLFVVFVSSYLSGSFYFSFWSNNERSEGLLLLLHLFLFLIVLTGFFNPAEDNEDLELAHSRKWLALFDLSFLGSLLVSLYSLGQYFGIEHFLTSAGSRLTSTIGNAGYVAGYLIFNIFFGLVLLFFRKNKSLRFYYVLGILLQIFVVFNTLTRGGIIALVFSLFVFVVYLLFFHFKNNKLFRKTAATALIIVIAFTGFAFMSKDADWVRNNKILERVTSISANAVTAKNRLMTWESAYKGFKEKPLLGYGYENFYQVFDKYFNPKIYRKAGSVVWFDRAHNIIFDRLITGGIVGLIIYLSMLFIPVLYIWKYFYRNKTEKGYLVPLFLTLIVLSYFIQNLFIFEALVTYIPLFIVLAFLSRFCPSWNDKFFGSSAIYTFLLILGVIAFIPLLFTFTIKPAMANREFINILNMSQESGKLQEEYEKFVELLEEQGLGSQEYRQHFGEFVSALAGVKNLDFDFQVEACVKAEQEFEEQIARKPQSSRNYLMFMRFLNKTYQFKIDRLERSLQLFEKGIELSPDRPMFYHEVAYTQVYLGNFYKKQGSNEDAEQLFDKAVENMQIGIDLNDQVLESYVNMCMVLFAIDRPNVVQEYLDIMDEKEVDYHAKDYLERMAGVAVNAEKYEWAVRFYKELVEDIEPDNPNILINLALSYAHSGKNDEAVAVAEKVSELGEEYVEQSKLFIQDVLDGKFNK